MRGRRPEPMSMHVDHRCDGHGHPTPRHIEPYGRWPWQSTATSSAAQTSPMRSSLSRPRRSTRTPSDTLSTESRLIADRRGTGSPPCSNTTSLARPRMVVVQGATSVRFNRGMAASRESTTTGRLPTSGSSHHHTSPRAGSGLTLKTLRPPRETTPDHPRRRLPRAGARRRLRMQRRSRRHDAGREEKQAPDLGERHPSLGRACCVLW